MDSQEIREELRATLALCSAASISTQLIKRGLRNVAVRGVAPVRPDAPPMIGPAY